MMFLLLFFDMNNIYTFSKWWYFFAWLLVDLPWGYSLRKV